jgi:hypothetical protein
LAIGAAVATDLGQTTSNSPFCYWLTVPAVPAFSLPATWLAAERHRPAHSTWL